MDEAEILNIVIDSAQRGLGFGRWLLQHLMTIAAQQGSDKIFLEVRVSNQVAIKLYESLGFKRISMRKNYYPAVHGREDALILNYAIMRGL